MKATTMFVIAGEPDGRPRSRLRVACRPLPDREPARETVSVSSAAALKGAHIVPRPAVVGVTRRVSFMYPSAPLSATASSLHCAT
jgi:hypothetical protein